MHNVQYDLNIMLVSSKTMTQCCCESPDHNTELGINNKLQSFMFMSANYFQFD